MKVALVTAVYGDYDLPKTLPHGLRADAFLYTDNPGVAALAHAAGWNPIIDPLYHVATPMLRAKYWKTHPLEAAYGYDASVWIDGSMTITVPDFIEKCVAALGIDDVAMTPHPVRDCIYPEATVTRALARYADCDPIAQVNFYRDVIGHPAGWGLMASGASTRRHNDAVRSWGQFWWDDCVNWTYQDQLSLPVITRLMTLEGKLRWNTNMPWAQWWGISNHGS